MWEVGQHQVLGRPEVEQARDLSHADALELTGQVEARLGRPHQRAARKEPLEEEPSELLPVLLRQRVDVDLYPAVGGQPFQQLRVRGEPAAVRGADQLPHLVEVGADEGVEHDRHLAGIGVVAGRRTSIPVAPDAVGNLVDAVIEQVRQDVGA